MVSVCLSSAQSCAASSPLWSPMSRANIYSSPAGSASRLVELVSHLLALPLPPQRRHRHLGPVRIHTMQSQAQGVLLKALPPQRRHRHLGPVRIHMSQSQAQTVLLNPVARPSNSLRLRAPCGTKTCETGWLAWLDRDRLARRLRAWA